MANEVIQQRRNALGTFLGSEAVKKNLAMALPKHMTVDRMVRMTLTAATKTPKLLECTMESIGLSLLNAAQLGLEPNGRDAHLVPYENKRKGVVECQLMPDYKGLIQLAYRSGMVDDVSAMAVHEKDDFKYKLGTAKFLDFVPSDVEDPGELTHAWAMVSFKGGGAKFVVLNKAAIARRRKSSKTANRDDSPWNTYPEAMWAKSAVKELSKWMPQTPELAPFHQAVELDNAAESGVFVVDAPVMPISQEDMANDFARTTTASPKPAPRVDPPAPEPAPREPGSDDGPAVEPDPAEGPTKAQLWCMDMREAVADAVGVHQLEGLKQQIAGAVHAKAISLRQGEALTGLISEKRKALEPKRGPGRSRKNAAGQPSMLDDDGAGAQDL